MIQELLGGVLEERKLSIPPSLLLSDNSTSSTLSSSPSPLASSSPSLSASSSPSSSAPEQRENLRCPRCDSSNTKFCYYNNYNLTQPRHFCKTCRRYWTKGGALRNVPIGGGCRKAKPVLSTATGGKPSGGGSGGVKAKLTPPPASEFGGKPTELSSSSLLWGSSPHSSQLLALLRGAGLQNTNPNPSSILLGSHRIKEDGTGIVSEASATLAAEPMGLSLDPLGQLAGGHFPPQYSSYHQQQQQQNMLFPEMPSSGIQELYEKLRSSAGYYNDHLQAIMSSNGASCLSSSSVITAAMATGTAPTASASILEQPFQLSGSELGYWNPALAWSDLSTTNGVFP